MGSSCEPSPASSRSASMSGPGSSSTGSAGREPDGAGVSSSPRMNPGAGGAWRFDLAARSAAVNAPDLPQVPSTHFHATRSPWSVNWTSPPHLHGRAAVAGPVRRVSGFSSRNWLSRVDGESAGRTPSGSVIFGSPGPRHAPVHGCAAESGDQPRPAARAFGETEVHGPIIDRGGRIINPRDGDVNAPRCCVLGPKLPAGWAGKWVGSLLLNSPELG